MNLLNVKKDPLNVPCITLPARCKGRPTGVQASGLREKVWRTIRSVRLFSINDLLDLNAMGHEKDAPGNVLKYITCLAKFGVVVRMNRRDPGVALTSPGYVVWGLAIDLGWDAPVWRQVEQVLWNPNTSAPVALPVAAVDAAQNIKSRS